MMMPYSAYKNSKLDWLGDIPSHWDLVKLGACFKERNEKVSDKDFAALSVTKNGILPQMEHVAKTDAGDNRKKVCIGDFVINSRSDRKGSSGTSDYDGSVSLISIILEPRLYEPRFAHHLLRSYNFQEEFYKYGKGIVADLWSTRYSDMKNIFVPLMPVDEQKVIATFLDRETQRIDSLIEEKQTFIKLLKEKRQALISHVVTKGLNPNVEMQDSGIEWIGQVPKHWDVVQIRRVGTVDQGFAFSHAYQGNSSGEVAWFKVNDMNRPGNEIEMNSSTNYVSYQLTKELKVNLFPKGTVIFPRVGAALLTNKRRLLSDDAVVDDNLFGVIPRRINPHYLYLVLTLIDMASLCSPGLVPTITFANIKALRIPLPTEFEQQQIVESAKANADVIDELITEASRSIDLLKERRTSLISAAVTGKIDVREAV
jgi:type I restriction enzyme S subunit